MTKKKASTPQDIHYYRPLHLWATSLGILPQLRAPTSRRRRRPSCCSVLMALLYTGIHMYATYGKLTHMKAVFTPSVFITDLGGDLALFAANLTAIVRVGMLKAVRVRSFLAHMRTLDAELRSATARVRYPRRAFVVEFVCANVLFVLYYIYDANIWIATVTWEIYRWYILRDLQCFHVLVSALVVRNYTLAIRNRVRILNEVLLRLRPPPLRENVVHVVHRGWRNVVRMEVVQVRKMRRVFARVCVATGVFNEIFGWIYVVLYMVIVAYLLTSSNVALVYGIGDKKIGDGDFGWGVLTLCVLWCILPLIIGFLIFESADKVFFEMKRTPTICYSIIDDWLLFDEEHLIVPELEKFAQQVTNSQPEITAAGFFTVGYAIFFALIGSMSSYLIVLIQFM